MAVTKLSNSGIKTGILKYDSMLAGNAAYDPAATWLIQRVNGTGSSTTITFNNIPQGYQHLQIRFMARDTSASGNSESLLIRYNNVSTTSYGYHYLRGDGTSATASGIGLSDTSWNMGDAIGRGGLAANIMGVGIIDIHDYTSTSKLKTTRAFAGIDNNSTAGKVHLWSSLYNSTSAITRIDIISGNAAFTTSSTFALYGFKG